MKSFILASFLLLCQAVFSQVDTAIFYSDFEKQTFLNYLDSGPVPSIDLLFCIDADSNERAAFENELNRHVKTLKAAILGKSLKKQIRMIYSETHAKFLNKYNEETYFSEIAKNGTYNCVTASALYALILDQLKIDYIIKETPQHVYLIADPAGDQIMIETTQPINGTVVFDDKYKQSYVNYLKENKIISDLEFKNQPVDELFKKYYDENKTITLNQLAGIQYSNKGIRAYDNLNFTDAAINMEKAYLLYPSKSIKFTYYSVLLNLMDQDDKNKKYSGKTLAKFMNINSNTNFAGSVSEDYFNLMTNEYAINHPDLKAFETFYLNLKSYTHDSVDLDQINRIYYYYLGYSNYANQKNVEALAALKISYDINPENINTKQLIQEVASRHIIKDRNRESELDSLKHYFQIFPFLFKVDAFQSYTTYCYLRIIAESIKHSNKETALNYLNEFEELIRNNPGIALNENYVTNAYGEIASYYIKKTKYDEAENYYMKGIELAPNSYELREGLKQLLNVKTDLTEYIAMNKSSENSYMVLSAPDDLQSNTSFKDKINTCLPGTWLATTIIKNGKEEKVQGADKATLIFEKNNKLMANYGNNEKESMRWEIRTKEKLLYWIYSKDNSDYDVFKVLEIDSNTLKLQPYNDGKLSDEIMVFKSKEGK